MKKAILLLAVIFSCQGVNAQQTTRWPGNKKAVIVLTYDDALNSQLNIAVPQLEAARLKATFFLTGYMDGASIVRWRAISKNGYELANHTLFHPCIVKGNDPMASNNYSINRILNEIRIMNNYLFAIDGLNARTLAYPCCETSVSGKDYVDSLRKTGLIKYARIGGDSVSSIITDFKNLDPLRVPSYGVPQNITGTRLIAFVKAVEKSGGMGVIMFHGIGGDYITTPAAAHQQLITYLTEHKKDIWVATFQQAMDYATHH